MKKFITYVSLQKTDLKKMVYVPVDGELKTLAEQRRASRGQDYHTSFPVMCLVDDYVKPGDRVEMICMLAEGSESVKRNFETLKQELGALATEIGFSYELNTISVQPEEVAESHAHTFQTLVDLINNDDELFACCTFGTKPIPIIEMMALNYAYRLKKNVTVRSLVYGAVDHEKGDGHIYDIKELFYMEQLVNQFAREGRPDSEELIRQLLSFEAE